MTLDGAAFESEGLFERADALAAFGPLFDRLRDGYGGSVFVLGGAGLGKTTILRQSEARARSWAGSRVGRLLVGRADGVLFGSGHAFRFVDQLFAGLGADVFHGSTASATDAQRSNRFLSALRALDDCSSRAPLLLLLDDLHWADADSLAILEFLCRQIPTRAVAVVGTLRPWPAQAMETVRRLEIDGCVSMHELRPMSDDASKGLLAARVWGDVDPDVLDRASRSCGGNPLLIEEVARSLLGGSQVPAVEPFSTGRRAILLRRFAGVSDDTFRFLRAASTLGPAIRPAVVARMVDFDAPKTDVALEEAEAAGLLELREVAVGFVHPMFGRALYEGLQGPLRMELHEAAYRAIRFLGGSAREAAEHAIAAGLTDEVAISVMHQAGQDALESDQWLEATRLLSQAAKIAGRSASPDMTRELAEALLGGGSPHEAMSTLDKLADFPDVVGLRRARVLVVRGRVNLALGQAGPALECFEEAAEIFEPIDARLSVDALIRCAIITRYLVGPRETLKFAERAKELSQGAGTATLLHVEAAWGAAGVMLGMTAGFDILARTARAIESDPSVLEEFSDSGWWPLVWCSGAATICEQFESAEQLFELGFRIAERKGWPTAMGAHLVNHVDLSVRLGDLQGAERDLDELERLSELSPVLLPFSISLRTGLQLVMGLLVEAEIGCSELEELLDVFDRPPPSFLLLVMRIRGELELASARIDHACAAFELAETTANASGMLEPCVSLWWVPALDAYRQAGRFGDLHRIVTWLEEATIDLPCRWPRAGAMAGRAMLAEEAGDDDSASKYFDDALAGMDGVPMPLVRATLLSWQGAFQRRKGDQRSARRSLLSAFQLADSRGAGLIARRARIELRLAGGRLRRAPRAVGGLTPRESQVAEIASTGHTTSEIALQLGIATKTVEHHLEAVYRKLGIKSRRELMRKRFSEDLQLAAANPVVNRDPGDRDLSAPDAEARP